MWLVTVDCCVYVCTLGVDERSRWWSAVLALAIHWSSLIDSDDQNLADQSTLDCLYPVIDNVPKASHNSEYVCVLTTHIVVPVMIKWQPSLHEFNIIIVITLQRERTNYCLLCNSCSLIY